MGNRGRGSIPFPKDTTSSRYGSTNPLHRNIALDTLSLSDQHAAQGPLRPQDRNEPARTSNGGGWWYELSLVYFSSFWQQHLRLARLFAVESMAWSPTRAAVRCPQPRSGLPMKRPG